MTEARESACGNLGLFATKSYQAGDVILKENPIIVLAPSDKEGPSSKPAGRIDIPSSVEDRFHATFRSMVQAGLFWIQQQEKKGVLDLYFPQKESTSQEEQAIQKVSKEAANYIRNNQNSEKSIDFDVLEKVMLIWACNAFQGGRIYKIISRVNHNCNPNSIIQADGETQRLVAASEISQGEEITISYLGSMLYADTEARNDKLKKTKFFDCKCERCLTPENDKAGCIPCPTCHPRIAQHSLDEDVQYDDDQTVQYLTVSGGTCSQCQTKLDRSSKLCKTVLTVSSKIQSYLDSQEISTTETNNDDEILEEHVSLASTIMGDKHWTTNLLLLLLLDHRLSNISSAMLTTQEMPEMEDVAEAIDSLQRVCRYVESLNLKLDPGHVLGDVIIGTARTLVSLGDVKSQKYGGEWLDKISDYVSKFESDGRQKVVSTLKVAWKKHERNGDKSEEANRPNKKMKSNK